ncbi:MAG: hypothetical protein AABY22_16955 [Nanoarchaeota archaeon]
MIPNSANKIQCSYCRRIMTRYEKEFEICSCREFKNRVFIEISGGKRRKKFIYD